MLESHFQKINHQRLEIRESCRQAFVKPVAVRHPDKTKTRTFDHAKNKASQ